MRRTILVLFAAAISLSAQPEIVIDWEKREMTACPAEITRNITGNFRVKNANPLYTYKVNVAPIVSLPEIPSVWTSLVASQQAVSDRQPNISCEGFKKELPPVRKAIDAALTISRTQAGYPSVKASESHAAWKQVLAILAKYGSVTGCQALDELSALATDLRLRFPFEVSGQVEFGPNRKYLIKVEEQYAQETTIGGEKEFECKPESHTVSLSFGPAASKVGDREYSARKVPNSELNQLVVSGNSSFRPVFGALVNFALPFCNNDKLGLALSAGPAFKLSGGRADTSNLGFFAGTSIHLWRLLYITPGVHFGEFADTPAGFRPFDPVPANFGELTPVKRWTTRFGIAVTFRTNSFKGIMGGTKTETPRPSPNPR